MQNEKSKQQATLALFPCDFCGAASAIHRFPSETFGVEWHACSSCVALVMTEEWGLLIERIVAACAALQPIQKDEQAEFCHELMLAITNDCSSHKEPGTALEAVRMIN